MGEILLAGIASGLGLSFMVGPIFFYIIETSIIKGIKHALFVDLGVLISDILVILLCITFVDSITDFIKEYKQAMLLTTGIIFTCFGTAYLFKKVEMKSAKEIKGVEGSGFVFDIIKGFLLNIINPGLIIYWLFMVVIALGKAEGSPNATVNVILFFTFLLATYFSIDILKIMGAGYLRKFIRPSIIKRLNLVTGLIFLSVGLYLIVSYIAR